MVSGKWSTKIPFWCIIKTLLIFTDILELLFMIFNVWYWNIVRNSIKTVQKLLDAFLFDFCLVVNNMHCIQNVTNSMLTTEISETIRDTKPVIKWGQSWIFWYFRKICRENWFGTYCFSQNSKDLKISQGEIVLKLY